MMSVLFLLLCLLAVAGCFPIPGDGGSARRSAHKQPEDEGENTDEPPSETGVEENTPSSSLFNDSYMSWTWSIVQASISSYDGLPDDSSRDSYDVIIPSEVTLSVTPTRSSDSGNSGSSESSTGDVTTSHDSTNSQTNATTDSDDRHKNGSWLRRTFSSWAPFSYVVLTLGLILFLILLGILSSLIPRLVRNFDLKSLIAM